MLVNHIMSGISVRIQFNNRHRFKNNARASNRSNEYRLSDIQIASLEDRISNYRFMYCGDDDKIEYYKHILTFSSKNPTRLKYFNTSIYSTLKNRKNKNFIDFDYEEEFI